MKQGNNLKNRVFIQAIVLTFISLQSTYAISRQALYSNSELQQSKPRYEKRIQQLYKLGLWDFLEGREKRALSGVDIQLPLRGDHPLDVYAYSKRRPTVVFPISSLKFIEDLCLAYAWRYVNRYSLEPIDEYLAMLKYKSARDFPGGKYPPPLKALGVPAKVWEKDKKVDDLSLNFRNTAWAFILAHELAHLRFRHIGNQGVKPIHSQQNEKEADAFAVDLLSRSDTIPMGMILWFQASVGYFPNRADYKTEAEYQKWRTQKATHPINPERLRNLGVLLNQKAGGSLDPGHAEIMRFIGGKLVGMGDILSEPDMQRLIARCAVLGNLESLKRLHSRPCQ